MQELFKNPPPAFTIKEVVGFLYEKYNLRGNLKVLPSDRDQNFLIYSKPDNYVFKIFNSDESSLTIDMQISALKHILKSNFPYNVPEPIDKKYKIKKGEDYFFICLFKYVKGRFLFESELQKNQYQAVGKFMGKLSRVLEGFDHPGGHRQFEWDVQDLTPLYKRIKTIQSKENQNTVNYFVQQYEKKATPMIKYFRKSLIHNDGNDHNILVDTNGSVKGIIDFGDMIYSYTILEPAVCMSYIGQNHKRPLKAMSYFLKGYRSTFLLHYEELLTILHMVSIRLCISVSMAAWRKTLFPENQYLTVSEDSSWILLNFLKEKNLDNWIKEHILDKQ